MKFAQAAGPGCRRPEHSQCLKRPSMTPKRREDIRLIFLTSGAVHHRQEYLNDDWVAEKWSTPSLAVVLGSGKKSHIETHTYPNGEPPVSPLPL